MEDAPDSNLIFIVPSSVEDNDTITTILDDPLGVCRENAIASVGEENSFSCLQLSGNVADIDSESLRIPKSSNDVILPSPPDIIRINLSPTPSGKGDVHLNLSAEEMDSGRLSPDMLCSNDYPSNRLSSCKEGNIVLNESATADNIIESLDVSPTKMDNRKLGGFVLGDDNPFDAETESYSEPRLTLDSKPSNSMSFYLNKLNDRDSNSAPIFLTASPQPNTEDTDSRMALRSLNCDHGVRENMMEMDSIDVILKDVPMRCTEESSDSPRLDKDLGSKGSLQSQVHEMISQAYSQEELDLHLSLESQLFNDTPAGDSQSLVIDERSGNIDNKNICDVRIDQPSMGTTVNHFQSSGFSMQSNGDDQPQFCSDSITRDSSAIDDLSVVSHRGEISNGSFQSDQTKQSIDFKVQKNDDPIDNIAILESSTKSVDNVVEWQEIPSSVNSDSIHIDVHNKSSQILIFEEEDSNSVTKPEGESISLSMQSTYVNENNSVEVNGPASSQDIVDSQYIGSSSDVAMSLELSAARGCDTIGEIETQPFPPTPLSAPSERDNVKIIEATAKSKDIDDDEVLVVVKATLQGIVESVTTDVEQNTERPDDIESSKKLSVGDNQAVIGADKTEFANPDKVTKLKRKRGRIKSNTRTIKMGKYRSNATPVERKEDEEHDKSLDAIANSDNSVPKCDISPNKDGYVYRNIRLEIEETLLNGKVVHKKVLQKKVRYLKKTSSSVPSSQSSNGSGYLADTSSSSRSSIDNSTQTDLIDSQGAIPRISSVPPIPRDLSGSSSSSISSSAHNMRPSILPESPELIASQKAKSPRPSSPSPSMSQLSQYIEPSPRKRPILVNAATSPLVVLTPLSTEMIASHVSGFRIGRKQYSSIDTPSFDDIDPPLGSTPVEYKDRNDTSSDISTSNSPEIRYPGDSSQFFAIPVMESTQKTSPRSKTMQGGPDSSKFLEGIPVMAKCPTDEFYYPGTMHAQDPVSGKYTVVFDDDKKTRQIRESDVLLIDRLDIGQEVFVQVHSDLEYNKGKIVSFVTSDEESAYLIEMAVKSDSQGKKARKFSKKDVIIKKDSLTLQQRKCLVQPPSRFSSSEVSLDNIVDGKRRLKRSSKSPGLGNRKKISPLANTSKTPLSTRKRRLLDIESSESSGSLHSASAKKPKRTKLSFQKTKLTPKDISAKAIFGRLAFLLTSTSENNHPSDYDSDMSYSTRGYNRENIKKKISDGGGQVMKNFSQLMSCHLDEVYVISDHYCRTMNYLNALAAGIKCISFQWIDDSTSMQALQPLSNYLLPAGYSLQQHKVVERLGVDIQPLHGLQPYVLLTDINLWKPLLNRAGCDIVSIDKNDSIDFDVSCEVFITDSSCDDETMTKAISLNIPVVTVEWVIQCLISSEKLPYDGHSLYKKFS